MAVGNEEIFRAIGELTAKVDILQDTQKEAARKTESLVDRTATLEGEMRNVQTSVSSLRPFAEKAQQWENTGKVALAASGFVGGGIVFLIGLFKEKILGLFGWH
jgi:hypothetical protein